MPALLKAYLMEKLQKQKNLSVFIINNVDGDVGNLLRIRLGILNRSLIPICHHGNAQNNNNNGCKESIIIELYIKKFLLIARY